MPSNVARAVSQEESSSLTELGVPQGRLPFTETRPVFWNVAVERGSGAVWPALPRSPFSHCCPPRGRAPQTRFCIISYPEHMQLLGLSASLQAGSQSCIGYLLNGCYGPGTFLGCEEAFIKNINIALPLPYGFDIFKQLLGF